ncbi:hypothetical protein H364_05273 [Pasteurella multocida 671/90]|nr:hypothetical protein PMCN06_0688 [Pasteurella multocida subsp. multocida str. HN06]EPE72302.1 hypothetical protein H364_05273 [Pasteurella multocida 671/90]
MPLTKKKFKIKAIKNEALERPDLNSMKILLNGLNN